MDQAHEAAFVEALAALLPPRSFVPTIGRRGGFINIEKTLTLPCYAKMSQDQRERWLADGARHDGH